MSGFALLRDRLDSIRDVLREHAPFSPTDFIRGISESGDRSIYAENLTRDLPEGDDLRFSALLDGGVEVGVFAERLPWDSDFFGYGVARLDAIFPLAAPYDQPRADFKVAVARLLDMARERGIRSLFASVQPRDLAVIRALGECGFSLIETRGYYHMPLGEYAYPDRFPVRTATGADAERLGHTARDMVNPYDRFHADPFIDPADADRLMVKWMQASIEEGFADVTIVPDDPDPTAFCTVKYHREHWDRWGLKIAQPVFSAVSREYRGWYRKLISEINYHLREIGAEHSYLITQITNIAVTWTWESLGYRYGRGEHIFRAVL